MIASPARPRPRLFGSAFRSATRRRPGRRAGHHRRPGRSGTYWAGLFIDVRCSRRRCPRWDGRLELPHRRRRPHEPMGDQNSTAAHRGAASRRRADNIAANGQEQYETLCRLIGRTTSSRMNASAIGNPQRQPRGAQPGNQRSAGRPVGRGMGGSLVGRRSARRPDPHGRREVALDQLTYRRFSIISRTMPMPRRSAAPSAWGRRQRCALRRRTAHRRIPPLLGNRTRNPALATVGAPAALGR